jgi:phosphatidylcholine synthase
VATSEKTSKRAGYALHVMTASGAVAGLLALQAVIDGNIRGALLWLVVCQVLDGLDGPIARKIDVVIHAPRVDGMFSIS